MFSSKKKEILDSEQREQYEYARRRVQQKKKLKAHFIAFLAGSLLLIIINPILKIGENFVVKNWFVWIILFWAFILLIHFLNVSIFHKFMGKEWENRQIEKLKAQQEKRIAELKKQLIKEVTVEEIKNNDLPPLEKEE